MGRIALCGQPMASRKSISMSWRTGHGWTGGFCGPTVGVPFVLLLCGVGARIVGAARVPNPDVIGANLLIHTATSCDMPAAWRLLSSRSFRAGWLVSMGSGGETPLMAAIRSACAELVALIVLHPDFDDKTIQKMRSRKALADHASQFWAGKEEAVQWALTVVDGVRNGKVSQEELKWDPRISGKELAWFLPKLGEWLPPMTLKEMGFERPEKPKWNLSGIAYTSEMHPGFVVSVDSGTTGRIDDIDKLWYLLVGHLQAAAFSEQKEATARHIRSIGWSLFFYAGRDAMVSHSYFIDQMSRQALDLPPDNSTVHEHVLAEGGNIAQAYASMAKMLGMLWNKTGDWLIFESPGKPSFNRQSR